MKDSTQTYSETPQQKLGIDTEELFLCDDMTLLKRHFPQIVHSERYSGDNKPVTYVDGFISLDEGTHFRSGYMDFKTTSIPLGSYPKTGAKDGTFLISPSCHKKLKSKSGSFLVILYIKNNLIVLYDYDKMKVINEDDRSTGKSTIRISTANEAIIRMNTVTL